MLKEDRSERDKAVKSYVRPPRTIPSGICPGCLRLRRHIWMDEGRESAFCDRFCKELYRLWIERRKKWSIAWQRPAFFGEGVSED